LKGVPKVEFKEVLTLFLNEIKAALKEFAQKQEAALKKRLKKILIVSVTGAILLGIGISLGGAASLFILIGSLRYLETFLPAWEAWLIMGATAAIAAAAFFVSLYLLIRSQLSTSEKPSEQKVQEKVAS
jgi:hypothetical protein